MIAFSCEGCGKAFEIVLFDARFALDLMSSHVRREDYGEAKGGGHMMDFDLIANDSLHWPLQNVACLFFSPAP